VATSWTTLSEILFSVDFFNSKDIHEIAKKIIGENISLSENMAVVERKL
jgi:hypothetical protein